MDQNGINVDQIKNKIKILKTDLTNSSKWVGNFIACMFFLLIPAFFIIKYYPFVDNLFLRFIIYISIGFSFVCSLILASMVINSKITDFKNNKNIKLELYYLESDLEYEELKDADRQFRLHQRELKRYYDMNISQAKLVSSLGGILLISGIIIIVVSLFLFVNRTDTPIYQSVIGCITGILTDFIGAFFIAMYNQTINSTISFHEKLSNSNNLILAYSIAMKINSSDIKDTTLSELSKNIVTAQR